MPETPSPAPDVPLRIIIFFAVQFAVCSYALRRGGAPERWTAWMMAVAAALTPLVVGLMKIDFREFSVAIFTLDLALLLAFTLLAARADRFWPLAVAALQLIAIAVHITRAIDPTILPAVYNQSVGKLAYPMMALLVIGTQRHHRRTRVGRESDWSVLKWWDDEPPCL